MSVTVTPALCPVVRARCLTLSVAAVAALLQDRLDGRGGSSLRCRRCATRARRSRAGCSVGRRRFLATEPLGALVIGALVRGLLDA